MVVKTSEIEDPFEVRLRKQERIKIYNISNEKGRHGYGKD